MALRVPDWRWRRKQPAEPASVREDAMAAHLVCIGKGNERGHAAEKVERFQNQVSDSLALGQGRRRR